jgi:tetratricopeptide (TPR) repeat protein
MIGKSWFHQKHDRDHARNVVALTAAVGSLRGALRRQRKGHHARKQLVALAWLQAALAGLHQLSGRLAKASAEFQRNSRFVDVHLGKEGLGWYVSELGQRADAAFYLALTDPSTRANAVLQIAEEAEDKGNTAQAVDNFFRGVGLTAVSSTLGFEDLRPRVERYLRLAEALGEPSIVQSAHFSLASACSADDRWDEAERHLLKCASWKSEWGMRQVLWEAAMGSLCFYRGNRQEALAYWARAHELAVRCGFRNQERDINRLLDAHA